MNPKEFAEIASVLAWPLKFTVFVAVFYKPVRALAERLAATLTVNTLIALVLRSNLPLGNRSALWMNCSKVHPND